jgi:hypothetical protein
MRAACALAYAVALGGCAAGNMPPGRTVGTIPQSPMAVATSVNVAGIPAVSQSFTGSMPVFGRNVPLPPGSWTVIANRTMSVRNAGTVAATIGLAQAEGGRLKAVYDVTVNARAMPTGMPLGPACVMSDVLWSNVVTAVPNGSQDCAAVVFLRPALWRENPQQSGFQNMRGLDQLGLVAPNIMVGLTIQERSRAWIMDALLMENPDLSGITPDMSTQRAQSAWTAYNYQSDPAKVRFVDHLKAEAQALRLRLREQVDAPGQFVPGSGLTPA